MKIAILFLSLLTSGSFADSDTCSNRLYCDVDICDSFFRVLNNDFQYYLKPSEQSIRVKYSEESIRKFCEIRGLAAQLLFDALVKKNSPIEYRPGDNEVVSGEIYSCEYTALWDSASQPAGNAYTCQTN